jgi:3-hydroxy-9,10-secoandrosta-1,3,5(10)-triene-9,17-dione monooxygenase
MTVGTLPQATRRDFSSVTYDEALRRAREIVPVLRERAQATEDARMLLRENEQLLHETGLFRFHQPKIFGGMELDFVAIFDIPAEIGRGCPSTAWNVGNLATHHWMLGYWDSETQHEVWDANPDALIASSIALAAGRGRKVDGGFVVTGRWPFSSGVDNSDWNMLAVTVYDGDKAVDWRLCLVPKTDYEIIDTWYAMGMAGTGSKDAHSRSPARAAATSIRAQRSTRARCSASRSSARPAYRCRPPRSALRKAPTSTSCSRWASAWAPTLARKCRISRRCRSSLPARAC